ncbi:MAG: MoaD/ThiS family protein [Dehalococcoidia bacterium]
MTTSQTNTAQITVRVSLFADLRRFLPPGEDGPQTFTLPAGSTVADLLAAIGVPPEDEVTPGLNGELAQRDTALHDGDDLVLFSPMEGG